MGEGDWVDAIARGRYETVARDLAALGTTEALWVFDRVADRPRDLSFLALGCEGGLRAADRLQAVGLLYRGRGAFGAPDFYGLTSRGRDAWMALRGWFR